MKRSRVKILFALIALIAVAYVALGRKEYAQNKSKVIKFIQENKDATPFEIAGELSSEGFTVTKTNLERIVELKKKSSSVQLIEYVKAM